jgi:hypothetical protein
VFFLAGKLDGDSGDILLVPGPHLSITGYCFFAPETPSRKRYRVVGWFAKRLERANERSRSDTYLGND